jgi:Integrase core domain
LDGVSALLSLADSRPVHPVQGAVPAIVAQRTGGGTATAARSPNLNAFAERFVRNIRQECLDRMVFFGEASLRRAVSEFVTHYTRERNHQGLNNKIIQPEFSEFPATGTVRRHERLGGLLNYCYREAA